MRHFRLAGDFGKKNWLVEIGRVTTLNSHSRNAHNRV